MLIAEARSIRYGATTCPIVSGSWVSKYDGRSYTKPAQVDIDHHVALSEAWDSGAHRWTAAQRRAFANDTYGPALNVMTPHLNRTQKSDRDPAQWLPPKRRCRYAAEWVQVKFRWRLTIDTKEKAALTTLLRGDCGGKKISTPKRAR